MSAQAEEVVASAGSLAQMADELNEVVARFRTAADESSHAPAEITKVAEWSKSAKRKARAA